MTTSRPHRPRCRITCLVGLFLVAGLVYGAEASGPVDVPDEIGLGERLALVAWLGERRIAIADPQDLPALRRAYLKRAHPELLSPAGTTGDGSLERGEAAAELYRRFGRNPATGATVQEIRALISKLEAEEAARLARDEVAARSDDQAHPRAPSPSPAAPVAGPPRPQASPPAITAPPGMPGRPAPEDQARMAANAAARTAAGIITGKTFPVFASRTVGGEDFELSQWKGKVVLVDFWATWCGPCMHEMPHVLATYRSHHAQGFEVVGISLDRDQAVLQQTLTAQSIPWPQLCDGLGWKSALARQYAIHAIPTAFLIGRDGTLIAADLRGPGLEAAVVKALDARP